MQESLSLRGIWFLPSQPEVGISGFLEYTPAKGIELQLLGTFEDRKQDRQRIELINGVSEDGKRITLYKCFQFQRSFNSNSFEICSYDALYMFIGEHFNSEDELRFDEVRCALADFDTWVGIFGFNKIESNDKTRKITIEYERPEDLVFKVEETINFAINFNAKYPLTRRRSNAAITQTTGVSIGHTIGAVSFETLWQWFQIFYRLMTLAYFTRPLINHLLVATKTFLEGGEQSFCCVDVYFKTERTIDNYRNKKTDNLFLFTYQEVKMNFGSILEKWFAIEKTLEPTVAGLIEVFRENEQPFESKFLVLSQAIETLHRRTTEETSYNNEQHRKKMLDILSCVQEDYKKWLEEKLQFSYEPSLKTRLKDLSDRIPNTLKVILLKPNVLKFLNQIRDSRNYYTHYNKTLKNRALKDNELFMLTERMKIFLICLVLKEIGFSDEDVVKSIFRKGLLLFNHVIDYEEVKEHFNNW